MTSDAIVDFITESNAIEGIYDMLSLRQAFLAWKWLMKQKKMTPSVVLKTHKLLMLNQPLRPDEKGYFRKEDVRVGEYKAPSWLFVEERIELWCRSMRVDEKYATEERSKALHVAYEHIHPFIDGNGRTGRMFMNWWRLQHNMPLLTILESEKEAYYKWFDTV